MKKILPYILMVVILVNVFAPFSVGLSDPSGTIKKNTAEATTVVPAEQMSFTQHYVEGKDSITISGQTPVPSLISDHDTIVITLTQNGNIVGTKTLTSSDLVKTTSKQVFNFSYAKDATYISGGRTAVAVYAGQFPYPDGFSTLALCNTALSNIDTQNGKLTFNPCVSTTNTTQALNTPATYSAVFTGLAPATVYQVSIIANFNSTNLPAPINKNIQNNVTTLDKDGNVVTPPPADSSTNVTAGNTPPADSVLPECWKGITGGILSIPGCIAQGIYYLLFMPTSFIFALTGEFFDWTFAYSVNDASYRTTFVVQGWGIVRDFCNMFFIFVLLYAAFGTILNIGGHFKTRSVVVSVIVVGLLINFSLFTTQVIIDASNILARVFYNSNAIVITKGSTAANGVTTSTVDVGPNGELPLSAALVNKVNPQNLIIHSKDVGAISSADNKANTNITTDTETLGTGTFILVTLLAVAVNIVGLIVFLSVGLIFVSRVIGLWFAMIFAPLMFFSYTIPALGDLEMIGHKKWWPETLKLAFLAPIFIFFMYLILKFLNTGLDLIQSNGQGGGINFVMSIVIPFVFIMVLLWKAKDIATTMSGKLGQSITGGIAAVGSLAIGGAALGAAAIGRNTAGAVAKYTQNDGARKNALSFKDTRDEAKKIRGINAFNPFAYLNLAGKAIGGVGKAAMAGVAQGVHVIPAGTDRSGIAKTLGQRFQDESKKIGDKAHSQHVLDEKAQALKGDKSAKFKDLTETEQKNVKDKIDKDLVAKVLYNKAYDKLDVLRGEKADVDAQMTASGSWAASALDAQHTAHTRGEHVHTADDMVNATKAGTAMSEFVNALRKGSYDIRNLSQVKSNSKGLAKFGVGLISGVAAGVRTGLKATNINHGSGQADFLKDVGHTISEAIKSAKIKVKIEESHGHSAAEAEAHGGGGHH